MNSLTQDRVLLVMSSIVLAAVLTGLSYLSSSSKSELAATAPVVTPSSVDESMTGTAAGSAFVSGDISPRQTVAVETLSVEAETSQDSSNHAYPLVTAETFETLEGIEQLFRVLKASHPYDETQIAQIYWTDDFGNQTVRCEDYDEYVMAFYTQMLSENLPLALEFHSFERWEDRYMDCAYHLYFNGSNIRELLPVLNSERHFLYDIGVTHRLHLQEPEIFLEHYRRLISEGEDFISPEFMAGIVEIAPENIIEEIRYKAVHARYPVNFILALEELGEDDVTQFVQQMWQQHLADDYPPRVTGALPGRSSRVTTAVNYGIEEAWDELYDLLLEGFFVEESFTYHLKLDDPKTTFPLVRDRLQFNSAKRQWQVLPLE